MFTVNCRKMIPVKELVTSTSLALGEAYMNDDLEIEGIYTRRWTISWDRWISLLWTRRC